MSDIDTLINTILRAQGRQRFLSDWDRELAQRLTASAATRQTPLVVPAPKGDGELRVAITSFPAGKQRRFDYASCEKQRRDLYSRHVSVVAPESPLTLTFNSATGRGKSTTWEGLRSEGWLAENDHWGIARLSEMFDTRDVARRLVAVRAGAKRARAAETTARREFAEMVAAMEKRVNIKRGDGVVTPRKSALKRSIDLDFAESVPDLAKFITYSPRAEYTQVRFVKVSDDPEGDEQPWEGE